MKIDTVRVLRIECDAAELAIILLGLDEMSRTDPNSTTARRAAEMYDDIVNAKQGLFD